MSCTFDLQVVAFFMSDGMAKLASQVSATAGTIGVYAAGIATVGCALYGVLWTVAFASGSQNGDVTSFFKWFARAMLFIALAGTASVYNDYVTTTFLEAPGEIGQLVASSGMGDSSVRYDAEGRLNIGTALDAAASQGICAGTSIWERSSFMSPVDSVGYFLAGIVVIIGVVIFVALAAGLAFMGYASLTVVLALGPLFIVAGIWDATRPMFESFIRTAINYALYGVVLMVIVGIAIGMISRFAGSDLGPAGADNDLFLTLRVAVRSLVVFAIASALLFKADDISASLVGGISLGAAGLAGRAASMAASPAKAAMTAAKMASNPGKAWGDFRGGEFHRNPMTGETTYRGLGEIRGAHKSALINARKNNGVGKGSN